MRRSLASCLVLAGSVLGLSACSSESTDPPPPPPPPASIAEVDASTGNKFFYDAGTGLLHLKAQTQTGRTQATLFVIPK